MNEWMTVKAYAKRHDQSEGHVRRLIREEKIKADKFGGRKWKILVRQQEAQTLFNKQKHLEYVGDLLSEASMNVKPLRDNFHTVFGLSYRPEDPSNPLRYMEVRGVRQLQWELPVERQDNWDIVLEHLKSGLPDTFKALHDFKGMLGVYWMEICRLEERYRERVQQLLDRDSETAKPNDSYFYRSILSEVDKEGEPPHKDEYSLDATSSLVIVTYDGNGLLSSQSGQVANEWTDKHMEFRREFINVHRPGLVEMREGIKAAADVIIKVIEEMNLRGRIPGECAICNATQ